MSYSFVPTLLLPRNVLLNIAKQKREEKKIGNEMAAVQTGK